MVIGYDIFHEKNKTIIHYYLRSEINIPETVQCILVRVFRRMNHMKAVRRKPRNIERALTMK
jgi:hypothetical protein